MDATKEPYNGAYNMYTYVTEELPEIVFREFRLLDSERVSITGHSMGGHGALMLVRLRYCLPILLCGWHLVNLQLQVKPKLLSNC